MLYFMLCRSKFWIYGTLEIKITNFSKATVMLTHLESAFKLALEKLLLWVTNWGLTNGS